MLTKETYRQSAYKIFDPFYKHSKYEVYKFQDTNEQCNIFDGPYCYYLSKYKGPKDLKNKFQNAEDVYNYYDKKIKTFTKRGQQRPQTAFTSGEYIPIYLTFDSFDYKTLNEDIYFPSEMIISDSGEKIVKVIVEGSLLLRNYQEGHKSRLGMTLNKEPSNTFAVAKDDLRFYMSQPFYFNSLYVRCGELFYNAFSANIEIEGYFDSKRVYKIEESISCGKNRQWKKIKGRSDTLVEYITIPKGVELDNISLGYNDDSIDRDDYDSSVEKYGTNKEVSEIINGMIKKALKQGASVKILEGDQINEENINEILNAAAEPNDE